MKNILATTKLYKNYQVAIPKIIRSKVDLDLNNTVLEWKYNKNTNEIIIIPRKKVELDDVLGIIEDDEEELNIDEMVY